MDSNIAVAFRRLYRVLHEGQHNVLAELKGYNDVKEDTFRVVLGVLCMLGRLRKDFKDWQSIKPQLRSELFGEMIALDISGASGANSVEHTMMRQRWAESIRATRGCAVRLRRVRRRATPCYHRLAPHGPTSNSIPIPT